MHSASCNYSRGQKMFPFPSVPRFLPFPFRSLQHVYRAKFESLFSNTPQFHIYTYLQYVPIYLQYTMANKIVIFFIQVKIPVFEPTSYVNLYVKCSFC